MIVRGSVSLSLSLSLSHTHTLSHSLSHSLTLSLSTLSDFLFFGSNKSYPLTIVDPATAVSFLRKGVSSSLSMTSSAGSLLGAMNMGICKGSISGMLFFYMDKEGKDRKRSRKRKISAARKEKKNKQKKTKQKKQKQKKNPPPHTNKQNVNNPPHPS